MKRVEKLEKLAKKEGKEVYIFKAGRNKYFITQYVQEYMSAKASLGYDNLETYTYDETVEVIKKLGERKFA